MGSIGNNNQKSSKAAPVVKEAPAESRVIDEKMEPRSRIGEDLAPRNAPAQKKERYRALGKELRRMFDDVVHEPIPTDLMELLQKLDKQSGDGGSEKGS